MTVATYQRSTARHAAHGLYAVVKDCDAHIRFSFLTGVSKFFAEKYRARGEPIHLVGVEFSRESRNVVGFEVERG